MPDYRLDEVRLAATKVPCGMSSIRWVGDFSMPQARFRRLGYVPREGYKLIFSQWKNDDWQILWINTLNC